MAGSIILSNERSDLDQCVMRGNLLETLSERPHCACKGTQDLLRDCLVYGFGFRETHSLLDEEVSAEGEGADLRSARRATAPQSYSWAMLWL